MNYFNNRGLVIIATLFIVSLIASASIDFLPDSNRSSAKEKEWSIPKILHEKANVQDKKQLDRLNIWNASTSSQSAGLIADKEWQLKGIVFDADIPYALIYQGELGKLAKYYVNDSLPNGEKLTDILRNSITFESENQMSTQQLHQQQTPL